jgi:hypothetical protein
MLLPACVAVMAQVPTPTVLTLVPDTVQTLLGLAPKLMAKPLLALALAVNGVALYWCVPMLLMLIVWVSGLIVNDCVTCGAAA